jgi:hypothetical protein
LILRQHNIRLDEKADVWLSVAIEGLWDKVLSENDDIRLTYRSSMSLQEIVTVGRQGDFRRVVATTWEEGSYGFAGKAVAEKAIIDSVEEMAESFANKFLATRDKEAKKKIDR